VCEFGHDEEPVISVAFSSNGSILAFATIKGNVFWEVINRDWSRISKDSSTDKKQLFLGDLYNDRIKPHIQLLFLPAMDVIDPKCTVLSVREIGEEHHKLGICIAKHAAVNRRFLAATSYDLGRNMDVVRLFDLQAGSWTELDCDDNLEIVGLYWRPFVAEVVVIRGSGGEFSEEFFRLLPTGKAKNVSHVTRGVLAEKEIVQNPGSTRL
jgi:hypothetical protein